MSAKVIKQRGAWWVRIHYNRKKRERRFGPTREDKQRAEVWAADKNAKIRRLEAGEHETGKPEGNPNPFDRYVQDWHRRYRSTFKPRYIETSESIIRIHLIPFFGSKDIRAIRESDLLDYINAKLNPDDGKRSQKPNTIQNALTIVRTVLNHAVREGDLDRNPANGIGRLIARVERASGSGTKIIESWTRAEADTLLALAAAHERRFEPVLRFLLSTGARRGEALGLRWEDIDFSRGRVTIRRARTKQHIVTPKNGKHRVIVMSPTLAASLWELLSLRRRETLKAGLPDVPDWVFCSETGGPLDERNLTRSWVRLRRRARKHGVRPFRLHSARHTFATLALEAGRNIRFVADQLGHANPAFTLQIYAHALPVEAQDMAFADFGGAGTVTPGVSERRSGVTGTSPHASTEQKPDEEDAATTWNSVGILERETRFELATLSLGS